MDFFGKPPDTGNRNRGKGGPAGLDGLAADLAECGEIAVARLGDALSEALTQAARQLDLQCAHAAVVHDREAMSDAASFARVRRHNLVTDFRAELEHRYVRACGRRPSPLEGYLIDFDASQLRVVKHELLDDSLAPGMLAEAIRSGCWESLCVLTPGFARRLGQTSMNPLDMPLSPKLIEAALADAARRQPWRHESKSILVRALCATLPGAVGRLYQDLAERLGQGRAPRDPAMAEDAAPLLELEPWRPEEASPTGTAPAPIPPLVSEPPLAFDPPPAEPVPEAPPAKPPWQPLLDQLSQLQDQARQLLAAETPPTATPVPPPFPSPSAPPEAAAGAPADVRMETAAEPHAPPPAARRARSPRPGRAPTSPRLRDLKVGCWLDIQEPGGAPKELKLAWISPLRNLYLLTNRNGDRALSLGADELEGLLRAGWARPIPPPAEGHPAAPPGPPVERKKRA